MNSEVVPGQHTVGTLVVEFVRSLKFLVAAAPPPVDADEHNRYNHQEQ